MATSKALQETGDSAVHSKVSTIKNTPGTLILQWLTYAFWGWTVLALAYLAGLSVNFMLDSSQLRYNDSEVVAYSLAAVMVLFVISLVCDVLYARREPLHKNGASTVIMIIHAVIFALCGIAALIVAVFAMVNMLINTVGVGNQTALYTGLIVALVYGATLVRTIRPLKFRKTPHVYWAFMSIAIVAVATLGIVGPAAHGRATRVDRMIESGLPRVSDAINTYAQKNGSLPKSLNDIKSQLRADAATIVTDGRVEYTPGTIMPSSATAMIKPEAQDPDSFITQKPSFAYELCVEYVAEVRQDYDTMMPYDERPNSPDTYQHDKGRVCYELQTGYTPYAR